MQPGQVSILDLLPQRPPFLMVDRITYHDPRRTQTTLLISPQNIFFDNGRLSESGLVENIAQTCAARMGYIGKILEGNTVKIGLIGSMKNMEIHRLPKAGEELLTEIKVLEEVFKMTLVAVAVHSAGELIAQGEMKISLTDITPKEDE